MLNPRHPYWTPQEDERLRTLWEAGWSTLTIGIAIGRGKNAVCGRARRLALPERESPIKGPVCSDKIARLRRELALAEQAVREELARAA